MAGLVELHTENNKTMTGINTTVLQLKQNHNTAMHESCRSVHIRCHGSYIYLGMCPVQNGGSNQMY